jgi:hypothetical protein
MSKFIDELIKELVKHSTAFTAKSIADAVQDSNTGSQSEFMRLPSPRARCPLTGMSRTSLAELVAPSEINDFQPPVRSFVLRKKGAARGIRLIDRADLIRYIREQSSSEGSS